MLRDVWLYATVRRVGRHHIKSYGLRMGCHSSSHMCVWSQTSKYIWHYVTKLLILLCSTVLRGRERSNSEKGVNIFFFSFSSFNNLTERDQTQQNPRHGFAVWVTKRISWRELIKHAPMHGSHADTAVASPWPKVLPGAECWVESAAEGGAKVRREG